MSIIKGALAAQYCLTRRNVSAIGLKTYLDDRGHSITLRHSQRILCQMESILPVEWRVSK